MDMGICILQRVPHAVPPWQADIHASRPPCSLPFKLTSVRLASHIISCFTTQLRTHNQIPYRPIAVSNFWSPGQFCSWGYPVGLSQSSQLLQQSNGMWGFTTASIKIAVIWYKVLCSFTSAMIPTDNFADFYDGNDTGKKCLIPQIASWIQSKGQWWRMHSILE
jgi:hypothetical protein